ncbi:hypothetical protein [Actinomadura fulvescens]|uniref:hypothetical protein n=1 Tax=Actinomadura fulvescens TaxID=46160 RepID=UPI0031D62445
MELTSREQDLVAAVRAGRVLTCGTLGPAELATSEDPDHLIRADVIRDILLGRLLDDPDPRGLWLRHARIIGPLDLECVRTDVTLALLSCHLGERVTLQQAELPFLKLDGSHTRGIDADGVHIRGHLALCGGFRADGPVRLLDARIDGNLECEQASMVNRTGPALAGDRARVQGSVFLRDGFEAAGTGEFGAVRFTSAQLGGFDLRDARLFNPGGPALVLYWSTTTWLRVPADAIRGAGDLHDPGTWSGTGTIGLDNLTYTDLRAGGADLDQWLRWLARHTPAYAAQPYQQLAALHRAAGHEPEARRILIAQQDDLLARGLVTGRWARLRHRLLRLLLGYGYQTWRALAALLAVTAMAVGLGLAAGHLHATPDRYVASHTDKSATPGTACSILEQVGVGLDRGLPLINTGVRERCDVDTVSVPGQLVSAVLWILQLLAWALATLVIAGYSGLIRRS